MDDLIKRRLAGAAIVLLGVFLLTLVLPRPGDEPALEAGAKRVTLDLTQPLPPEVKPEPPKPAAAAPALKEEPSVTAAEAAQAEPTIDAPPPEPVPAPVPKAEAPSPAPKAQPAPPPVAPPAAPSVAVAPSTGSKPVLKMEQKVMTPIPTHIAAQASTPAKTPAKAPAKSAAARKSAWYVQIGSYNSIDNARVALNQLKPATGTISPADTPSGTLYRVRLGPYPGKEQAKAARDQYAPKANLVED